MQHPPLIAISPNHFPAEDRHLYKHKALEYGEGAMATWVRAVGGLPIMPYRAGVEEPAELEALANATMVRCDGLLLSGGADVDPSAYGEALRDPRWAGDPLRDAHEIALYRAAVVLDKPVLGVCRGAQLVNVAEGGTLWQDLGTQRKSDLVHRDQDLYDDNRHDLEVAAGSLIAGLFEGEGAPRVNSVHHQAVRDLAPSATAEAWAPDGVVEGFIVRAHRWVVAVQWHPEWLGGASSRRLFTAFVEEAGR